MKKPKDLLEYVIVHEMVHLIEPTHSDRFIAILGRALPDLARGSRRTQRAAVSCRGMEGMKDNAAA